MRTAGEKMAAPRGGATEPTRSVQCVRPAMETSKVGTTSDVIIDGEMCKLRHEGMTEKLKEVTETEKLTETQGETQELKETPETREMDQVEEKLQEIDEHTHIELVRDNEVEHEECFVTWC